ncbi:MAG: hypothetical protein ONB05_11260, partial [candidate division KSB1 bacterium]|nr:hypothetical protein [candidate division KSB1 bacterium]
MPRWLEVCLGITFLLRIPSLFEPFWYGDEMIYLTLGEGIRRGITLYSGLHDNKPPLIYLLAAISGNVFWFRAILSFWMLATVTLFYYLVKRLFDDNEKIQKVAVYSFAILTSIPLFEGNIANAEIFLIGPIIFAMLVLTAKRTPTPNLMFAGVLFSIASLFKLPAALEIPVIFIYWLATRGLKLKNILDSVKKFLPIIAGFVIPVGITLVWFYSRGALADYLKAVFLENISYLSSWRPGDVQKTFILRNLPLLIRGGVVLVGLITIFLARKKLGKPFILASIWILFSLFAATLSERPYPHYFIQAIPAVSLFLGLLVAARDKEQALAVLPLLLASVIPVYYKYYYYPTFSYYVRFANLATRRISQEKYFSEFNQNTPRDYEIAKLITSSTRKDDPIFVWGDS